MKLGGLIFLPRGEEKPSLSPPKERVLYMIWGGGGGFRVEGLRIMV